MTINLIKKSAVGEKKNDIILFVHGAWHGAWCWERYFMDYFAKSGYDNYAFNLTKHDAPGKIKGINSLSLKNYVAELDEVVGKLEKEPIIIAHSMGGLIVQKYLEKKSCKKAILLASVPASGVLRTTLNLLFKRSYALPNILALNLYGLVNTPEKVKWALFSSITTPDELQYCASHTCSESFLAFLEMLFPNIETNYHTKIPMLIMAGEEDHLFTVKEHEKTAKKYSAKLKVIPSIGHNMMVDTKHDLVAEEIVKWLA